MQLVVIEQNIEDLIEFDKISLGSLFLYKDKLCIKTNYNFYQVIHHNNKSQEIFSPTLVEPVDIDFLIKEGKSRVKGYAAINSLIEGKILQETTNQNYFLRFNFENKKIQSIHFRHEDELNKTRSGSWEDLIDYVNSEGINFSDVEYIVRECLPKKYIEC